MKYYVKLVAETTISILRIIKSLCKFGCDKTGYDFLKDKIKRNDTCLVLGNGPSLLENINDLCKYGETDKIAVNYFANTDYYNQIKPQYYILLDPEFFLPEDIVSERIINNRNIVFENIVKKTTWDMTLFVPIQGKKIGVFKKYLQYNTNIKIVYFNCSSVISCKSVRHWMYKKNFGMPHAQNILVAALYVLLNIGYKSIYLLGAEHSWLQDIAVNDSNIVCLKDKHFYSEEDIKYQPFYKNQEEKQTFNMYEVLVAFALMFKGYYEIKEYADYLGANIYNATVNSYIDAFERIEL